MVFLSVIENGFDGSVRLHGAEPIRLLRGCRVGRRRSLRKSQEARDQEEGGEGEKHPEGQGAERCQEQGRQAGKDFKVLKNVDRFSGGRGTHCRMMDAV